jgi:hypothetical protein
MVNFTLNDSGKREQFETGSVRDTAEDKPRYELIPVEALERLAMLYTRGAKVYGPDNWSRGQPFRRVFGSMLRHAFAWAKGERDEDHLAAVAWNAFALMYFEEALKKGTLPDSLNDMKIPLENVNKQKRFTLENVFTDK